MNVDDLVPYKAPNQESDVHPLDKAIPVDMIRIPDLQEQSSFYQWASSQLEALILQLHINRIFQQQQVEVVLVSKPASKNVQMPRDMFYFAS